MCPHIINEFKVSNEKMSVEKAQALKEKEELQTQSQSLETEIEQACKSIMELNILEDAAATKKVMKLAVAVGTSKDKQGYF